MVFLSCVSSLRHLVNFMDMKFSLGQSVRMGDTSTRYAQQLRHPRHSCTIVSYYLFSSILWNRCIVLSFQVEECFHMEKKEPIVYAVSRRTDYMLTVRA